MSVSTPDGQEVVQHGDGDWYTDDWLYVWLGDSLRDDADPHTGKGRWDFIAENGLKHLIEKDLVFVNYFPFRPVEEGETRHMTVRVIANDVFSWATAESVSISSDAELESLCRMVKQPAGLTKWVCQKRNMKPQNPIVEDLKQSGLWDDDFEALPDNPPEHQCWSGVNCEMHGVVIDG